MQSPARIDFDANKDLKLEIKILDNKLQTFWSKLSRQWCLSIQFSYSTKRPYYELM